MLSITINDYLTNVYTFFQEKKTLHDTKKASEWMRWWFKEHDSMPEPPTRVLQSAFVLWQQEKVNFKDKIGPDKVFHQYWEQSVNAGICLLIHNSVYPIRYRYFLVLDGSNRNKNERQKRTQTARSRMEISLRRRTGEC